MSASEQQRLEEKRRRADGRKVGQAFDRVSRILINLDPNQRERVIQATVIIFDINPPLGETDDQAR